MPGRMPTNSGVLLPIPVVGGPLPFWVTVNNRPATRTVAVRGVPLVFAVTEKGTVAPPKPLVTPVRASHAAELEAVQDKLSGPVMVMVPLVLTAGKVTLLAASAKNGCCAVAQTDWLWPEGRPRLSTATTV